MKWFHFIMLVFLYMSFVQSFPCLWPIAYSWSVIPIHGKQVHPTMWPELSLTTAYACIKYAQVFTRWHSVSSSLCVIYDRISCKKISQSFHVCIRGSFHPSTLLILSENRFSFVHIWQPPPSRMYGTQTVLHERCWENNPEPQWLHRRSENSKHSPLKCVGKKYIHKQILVHLVHWDAYYNIA